MLEKDSKALGEDNKVNTDTNFYNSYDNVICFNKISNWTNTYKQNKLFSLFYIDYSKLSELEEVLENAFYSLIKKENLKKHSGIIKECFENSCNILYNRQIFEDVIQKQKSYEIDYVADFFLYVLRMFFNRYNSKYILSKNQCQDVKKLCKNIVSIKKNPDQLDIIDKISARDIVEYLQGLSSKINYKTEQ